MASSYPGALDTLTNPTSTDYQDTVDHAAQHANANDAIEAVQATLGVDPQGDAATVAARIGVISNFASPNAGGIVTGNYYDQAFHSANASTTACVANRMELFPYYTSVPITIDQIGVACSTAVASSNAKVVIYDVDANGWPDNLLLESTNLDCSTTGYKSYSTSFTFNSGTMYWVGYRSSSTQTLRSIPATSSPNLGVNGSNGTNYFSALRRTVTFANAAPDPWTFSSSELTGAVIQVSIRFRAA